MDIDVVEVEGKPAAVIRKRLTLAEIPAGVMPLVDRVWQFLRGGGADEHGHNVWIYHHTDDGHVDVEVGVEVRDGFEEKEGVVRTVTPSGRAAHAVFHGAYGALPRVHQELIAWCADHGHTRAGSNWEVYGDPSPDPEKCRTDVYHLLKD
ncbi:MAG: GyrI-like domain-containing protein [Myxococcales bacterium]|nr:GyrI-like domain-containing protein [Myxococcales bacterium]